MDLNMLSGIKVCNNCRQPKLKIQFSKHSGSKDGLQNKCKECSKKYYEENKEQYKERQKEYYENNKNEISIYHKEYYKKNSNKIKDYYNKNKDEISKNRKQYRSSENGYIRNWCSHTLWAHKKRNFEVLITPSELYDIVSNIKSCAICGKPVEWWPTGKLTHASPTLDRKYNENIISHNNIQILCHQCNMGKGQMSNDEYINHCIRVMKFNSEENSE